MRNRRRRSFASLLGLSFALMAILLGCKNSSESAGPAEVGGGPAEAGGGTAKSYLFCSWNVENFFDDKNDNRKGPGDKEYDPWYANNPDILRLKLAKLTEALLRMNGGHGPDIIALVEVESVRAAELLKNALNDKLPRGAILYREVVMKELTAGRHIAPAVITRLPVTRDRTRLLGKKQRILQTQITVGGQDLNLIVAHFTSRLDAKGSEARREAYADSIYGAVRAMYANNPNVNVLICGDFNDTPEDISITKHLHATGDRKAVLRKPTDGPLLFNLMAGKAPATFGTHYHSGWFIFDQIVVSPAMLNPKGWSCDPDSVTTFKDGLIRAGDKLGRPWKFGSPNEKLPRGYSDHFPVTVRLKFSGR